MVDWNLFWTIWALDYRRAAPHQFEEAKGLRLYYLKYPCIDRRYAGAETPGDQIGWGGFAMKIGLALAPKYWTTDGSGNRRRRFRQI